MANQIYICNDDGVERLMWDPSVANLEEYTLIDPTFSFELNQAGTLEFTMPPENVCNDWITRMKTRFSYYWDDRQGNKTLLWRGRCISDEYDEYGNHSVTCEGLLNYFNDTVSRDSDKDKPKSSGESGEGETEEESGIPLWLYMAIIVAEHNLESVTYGQPFYFETVQDVTDLKNSKTFNILDCAKTLYYWQNQNGNDLYIEGIKVTLQNYRTLVTLLPALKWIDVRVAWNPTKQAYCDIRITTSLVHKVTGCDVSPVDKELVNVSVSGYPSHKSLLDSLVSENEGYMFLTYEHIYDSIRGIYVDMPRLWYLKNIIQMGHQTLTWGQNIVSCKVNVDYSDMCNCLIPVASPDEKISAYWDGTITPLFGRDYVVNRTSREKFGALWHGENWSDAKEPRTLALRAIDYLAKHSKPEWTIELEVVDMGELDPEYDPLIIGYRYKVVIPPIGVDTNYLLKAGTMYLDSPERNSYTFYAQFRAYDEADFQNGEDQLTRTHDELMSDTVAYFKTQYGNTTAFNRAIKNVMDTQPINPIAGAISTGWTSLDMAAYYTALKWFYSTGLDASTTQYAPFGEGQFVLVNVKNPTTGITFQVALCSELVKAGLAAYRRWSGSTRLPSYRINPSIQQLGVYIQGWDIMDLSDNNAEWNSTSS